MGLHAVAFQNVGVDGSLGQEGDALQFPGLLVEDLDELAADDLPLPLRLLHPGQQVQKAVRGVYVDQIGVQLIPEHLNDLLALALAHEAVVYVDAHQLLANGLDQQGGHHGGVHAAAEGQQHLLLPHLGPDLFHLLRDKGLRQLRRVDPPHIGGTHIVFHLLSSISEFQVFSNFLYHDSMKKSIKI